LVKRKKEKTLHVCMEQGGLKVIISKGFMTDGDDDHLNERMVTVYGRNDSVW